MTMYYSRITRLQSQVQKSSSVELMMKFHCHTTQCKKQFNKYLFCCFDNRLPAVQYSLALIGSNFLFF